MIRSFMLGVKNEKTLTVSTASYGVTEKLRKDRDALMKRRFRQLAFIAFVSFVASKMMGKNMRAQSKAREHKKLKKIA